MKTLLKKSWILATLFIASILFISCGEVLSEKDKIDYGRCDDSTIEDVLLTTATSVEESSCFVLEGTLVFKADDFYCRSGAYYIEDEDGQSMYLRGAMNNSDYDVDNSYLVNQPDSVVTWEDVKISGDFYPAKDEDYYADMDPICVNQIGIDLDVVE